MMTQIKQQLTLGVKVTSTGGNIPTKAYSHPAGCDLHAPGTMLLPARNHLVIPMGIAVTLPPGTYGRIAAKSGLAAKKGIDIGAGVIDNDYNGEISVVIFNHSDDNIIITENEPIAQLICEKYQDVRIELTNPT